MVAKFGRQIHAFGVVRWDSSAKRRFVNSGRDRSDLIELMFARLLMLIFATRVGRFLCEQNSLAKMDSVSIDF